MRPRREKRNYSTTAGTSFIICPFFSAHENKAIYCEGIIDGTRNGLFFETEEEKRFHKHTYCENKCKCCEIYASIRHWKWPEEDA